MKEILIATLLVISPFTDLKKIARINKYKEEAKKAYLSNNFQLAYDKYTFLIDSMSVNEEEVLLDYAHTLYHLNDTANAISNYKKLSLSTNKKINSNAEMQLGKLMFDKKKYRLALEHYKNALRKDPTNQESRYNYELLKKVIRKQEEENKDQKQQDDKKSEEENKDQKQQDDKKSEEENKDQKQQDDKKSEEESKDQKQQDDKKSEEESKDQKQQDDKKSEEENKDQKQQDDKKSEEESKDQKQQDDKKSEEENKDQKQQDDKKSEEENKDQKQQDDKKSEEENKDQKQPSPSPSEKLKKINISQEKAKMILEAMRNNEIQYIQQNRRKATKKRSSDKPDW